MAKLISRIASWLACARRRLPSLSALAIAAVLTLSGALDFLEREMVDLRFRLIQRPAVDGVVIVAIDSPSIRDLGAWPWPRRHHATVLDALLHAGAGRIALDIDFSSPSNEEDDAALEAALRRADMPVILPVFRQVAQVGQNRVVVETEPLARFKRYAELASVNVRPAEDGLVRRLATHEPWGEGVVPTLAARLAGSQAGRPGLFSLDFGIDLDGIPIIPFTEVLAGHVDPALVRGRTVIIGSTAVELQDITPVPVHRAMAGPLIHALGYQSLVQGRALQSTGIGISLTIMALLTFLLCPRFSEWSWRTGIGVLLALWGVLLAVTFGAYAAMPLLVTISPILMLVTLLFLAGLVSRGDSQALMLLVQGVRLRRVDMLMRSVVENSFDGIVTIGVDGRVVTANKAARRLFSYDDAEIVARPVEALLPDFRNGEHTDSPGQEETMARRSDDSYFSAELSVSDATSEGEAVTVITVRDITERKTHQALLEYQATHDELTSLPNRGALTGRIEEALAQGETDGLPIALFLLDLDHFKEINDTLGHHVGDSLLCDVATRLSATVGETASVARLGGDEFAVLLPPPATKEDAARMGQRILEAFTRPFAFSDLFLEVGASVGVALFPDHARDSSRLLQCADVAMYIAKSDQMGVAFYDEGRDQHSVRHLALSGDLRRAIEQREIAFYYQPKIDFANGQMLGVEVLARWNHPEHGFISPDEFIPQAERTGLIQPLTKWAIDSTLEKLAEWSRNGFDFIAAVNLSTRNLHDRELPDILAGRLRHYGVDPGRLTLEITESAIMSNPDGALWVIERLHDLGVRLSIDDFGTGYSSLAYLKMLPVDELKIDKSFVMEMTTNTNDAVIVRSTIELAHNLGLKVVAEGVETVDHVDALVRLGCDVGQGYLFSRPVPAEDLVEWIETSKWGPKRRADSIPTVAS